MAGKIHLILIIAFVASSYAPAQEGTTAPKGNSKADAVALIETLRRADDSERPPLIAKLVALGGDALAMTREARDMASEPRLKRAFSKAATWILAGMLREHLHKALETQLTFDGQYSHLKKYGVEGIDALFALLADEAVPFGYREAACRALADVGDKSLLDRLKALYHDPLLVPGLREEVGILMAVFGDTHAVDAEIRRFERLAESRTPFDTRRLGALEKLANLYYRIRHYQAAVERYDEILELTGKFYDALKERGAPRETLNSFAAQLHLHYYNAACSNTLNNNLDRAKEYLRKAVSGNATFFKSMEKDGDLLKLRKDPSYRAFRRELGRLFEGKEL